MSGSAPERNNGTSSRRQGFPRRLRLLTARDYQRVFAQPFRSSDAVLTLYARSNDLGYARLGLAVSRKAAPKAHQRNRIKRLARESFRVQAADLPGIDFVIMARSGASQRSNSQIRASFENHLRRLVRLCANS